MPTIPRGLNVVVDNYAIGSPDGVMRTDVAGGLARYGLEWDRGVQQFRVTIVMTALQFFAWSTFYMHTIKKGALSFDMEINSGFGMQTHSVNIMPGSYSATPSGGGEHTVWTVGFMVEAESAAYSMSSSEAASFLALYEAEGDNLAALLNAISLFANQHVLVLA